jgi:hypothetical protein
MQGEFDQISEKERFCQVGKLQHIWGVMGRDGLANRLSTSAEGRPAYPHQAFPKIYTDHASINWTHDSRQPRGVFLEWYQCWKIH